MVTGEAVKVDWDALPSRHETEAAVDRYYVWVCHCKVLGKFYWISTI